MKLRKGEKLCLALVMCMIISTVGLLIGQAVAVTGEEITFKYEEAVFN